ncbi:MAG: cytochrome ubiquinol oxidase subunit I [Blastopirellula sp.]|nr:cytochrome ubiquinol oxidase subunit I [Blastopirellula sp.]
MPDSTLLAQIAVAENLLPARMQMAFTLGFHITLACLGVGLPVLMLAAEWQFLRTGDTLWRTLARRWSKAFAVLFAVGAVSGTVLSFELGLLWPKFMGIYGSVIGLPFTMEGFAFFFEAIFAGIYLYGWDRLPPRVHWYTGIPVAISGAFSAFFVITANAFMNCPDGFRMEDGTPVEIRPLTAMFNAASGAMISHMLVAAYLVTGFVVASYYASRMLRGQNTQYHRRALTLALLLALPLVPVQMMIGDWSAKVVAKTQPVKLAAMEGQFKTERGAPLRIGGIPNERTRSTDYAIEIPKFLSFLAYSDFNAEVRGLDDFPPEDLPPVPIVHFAFQAMVGIGSLMMLIAAWTAWHGFRYRQWPASRWFLLALVAMGPLSVVAMQAGWVVTEVGRQPWIIHGYLRTADAVTDAPGVWTVFAVTMLVYATIGVGTVTVLRQLARLPIEPSTD